MKTPLRTVLPALILALPASLHAQYCEPDSFTLGTEPICRVAFADITNDSPSSTDQPDHDDFTSIVAHVVPGETYTVTVRGNTAGTPPNHLAMNFDWDLDYTFETRVELGDLEGGDCDTDATGSFTVPLTASLGASRMRIVKTYTYNADDTGCSWGSNYGQSEDYTIEVVDENAGIATVNAKPFGIRPNPSTGDFVLVNTGDDAVVDIQVMDLSGRTVHAERAVFAPATGHALHLTGVLPAGTYFVQTRCAGATAVAKLLVN